MGIMRLNDIVLKDVSKSFEQGTQNLPVLTGVSMQFLKGKTYAITGVSGVGKSTLVHIIAGLDEPTSGAVLYNNDNVWSLPVARREQILNRQIGVVFQESYLISQLTVLENVMLKGLIDLQKQEELCINALELLARVGLKDKAYEFPGALSGGQQQRVALVRALFNKPAFLVADEPTGNLDVQTGKEIIDLLINWCAQWSMGLIISSHDQYVAGSMDNLLSIESGKLIIHN